MAQTHSYTQSTSSHDMLVSLGRELGRIAQALAMVSKKLQEIPSVPTTVTLTKKTDPEMFTEAFIETVRASRKEFEKGEYTEYRKFRSSLGK